MSRLIQAVCLCTLLSSLPARGGEVGFAEEFALAKDRAEALKKLIPGTEDYYYFYCLHFLNTAQFDKAVAMTRPWFERFNQTPRLTEIQTRHALLTYETNPQASLDYFRNRLGLNFDHQKVIHGTSPSLPTALDPKLISREALATHSTWRWSQGGDNYEDAAIDWVLTTRTEPNLRRHLLQRLTRPDIADLSKIVADDLRTIHSGGFGSLHAHQIMTLKQLDELLKLTPDLIHQQRFVEQYIARLHPTDDEDWRRDPKLTRAYLDRLLTFTRKLHPTFNPLKAHVLFHRLILDETQGKMDKALFVEYLSLPRNQGYMSKTMLESQAARNTPAHLGGNYTPMTQLNVVPADEQVVRNYLKYFLADAKNPKEFEPYINDVYLQHLFAEMQIENGTGEPETWAANLPPELFRQLKDRIDIDFSPTNKTEFAADEKVELELFVKNVPSLMVKVFEVNTQNFYRTQNREVDTAINLDGLVAGSEQTVTLDRSPFKRISKKMAFPQIDKPGVYVVDFIGAGKSSRALIRKGRLRTLQTIGTAGQKLTVIDEANKIVPGATVWLGGQEYKADDKGVAVVPFSTTPGRRPIVISKGDFSSLDFLDHQPEGYSLVAGIHVDREALLTQRLAPVTVRPGVRLNGVPVSVKLLDDVRLVITATDQDGIGSSTEVPNFKLFEDRESTHEFRVPARLVNLRVTLIGKIKTLSTGVEISLAAAESFGLNGVAKTDKIEDLHCARFGDDYVLELLGRTGEAKPDRPVQVVVKHREFKETVNLTLKSDAQGRIHLGKLQDVAFVIATGPEGTSHQWSLPENRHTFRPAVHAAQGEPIAVPYVGSMPKADRSELALFELRGASIHGDRFDALSVKDGTLELNGLTAGDYDLFVKRTGERIRIRVADGPTQAGHVLGKLRHLELSPLKPVQVASLNVDDESVTVKLRDFSPFTRLHLYATRYLPGSSGFDHLASVRDHELRGVFPIQTESIYLAGRNIGDEYRYVLDRRFQKKFPGNMAERPSLLLNPWVVRSTETGEQLAEAGQDYARQLKSTGGGGFGGPPAASAPAPAKPHWAAPEPNAADSAAFASLDFLYEPSVSLLNLVPDQDGVVKISRKLLGDRSTIQVLAVDPVNTTLRTVSIKEQKTAFADLRLRDGLDPAKHFTQQRQVNVLETGKPFVIEDAISSRFEVYDSLSKVFGLYSTLTHDPKLQEFSFVLNWPKLKPDEKKSLYSKYACHELSFFVMKKDPDFFKSVVVPYLANKKDKTFLDHFLLGNDLREYTRPWEHARLNTAEKVFLSRRLDGEVSKTARHLTDLFRLLPPNPDRTRVLFESALKADDLSDYNIRLDTPGKEILFGRLDSEKKLPMLADRPASGLGGKPGEPQAKFKAQGDRFGLQNGEGEVKELAKRAEEMKAERGFLAQDGKKSRSGATKGDDKGKADKNFALGIEARLDDAEAFYFEADRKAAGATPARLYRKVDLTQELAENNYYKLPIQQQIASLVGVNPFWVDYANHDGKGPFLSANLAEASANFTEMMLALSVLDLPFTAEKHEVKFDQGKMTMTPGGTALAFHEEVKPAGEVAKNVQILVSQNFYRHGDRYRDENGERYDKFVTEEFVAQTVYGCQVVVTNPSPSRQRLSVLTQIPVGSLPVANGQATKTHLLDLEPYRTQVIDFLFYFPRAGQFAQFPVHVAKSEQLVSFASPFKFNVVDKPTKLDTQSWEYVSQNGSAEEVIAFLNRENIHALDLSQIAFRMKDKRFFEIATGLLKARHAFEPTLWSYAIRHNEPALAREYLSTVDMIVNECGGPISTPLLVVDPVVRHQYEHLEYKPLVNARAHSLGRDRQIVNDRFSQQYQHFLKVLSYHPKLTDDDLMSVCYYLLLQDRVEDALTAWKQVRSENVASRMQYDYCAAYLDLFQDEPKKARSIVAQYANHPVERWRNAFVSIGKQLDEVEGKGPKLVDADDQAQQQAILAAKEPSFEFTVAKKNINLTWKNVETVRINYYLMDVELLFSRNPFVSQSGSGQFSQIRPNQTQEVKLPAFQTKGEIPMPENLAEKNVLVEIVAGGKTRSVPVLANVMSVNLNENYGQIQVTDATSGKALSKVYVKCYSRLADGSVKFHKDGYTDLRGKFDYASVSTPERQGISRYGLLILSETQGAIIKEAAPPQQ